MNLFTNIFLMIVSPTVGWERINKLSIPPKMLQSQVLFPTLALLALTSMLQIFFADTTLTMALVQAIIAFAAYFFTFYISSIVMNFYSPGETQEAKDRMDNLLMFALKYLIILNILSNLLPSDFPILKFLQLYVVFIIYRGLGYVNYNEKPWVFITIATVSLLATPIIIKFILGLILPN